MVEAPRKNIMRFYSEKRAKIEFSGFERNLLLDPLKLTEENEIISLFNKVQEKINSFFTEQNDEKTTIIDDKTEFYVAKAKLNELDNDEIFNSFSADVEPDGGVVVNVMQYETCLCVNNHIGNLVKLRELIKNDVKDNRLFNTINQKPNKSTKPLYGNKKTEKPTINELIRKYLCLIDFCFFAIKKSSDLIAYRDNEFFEIYDVYPIRIRFRNSTGIYLITNILSNYFYMISKSVCKEIYKKTDKIENIIISFPSNFDIMQQMEIKRVVQNAGLNVSHMISKNEIDSLLFQVQFELDKLKRSSEIAIANTEVFNDKELKHIDTDKHYIEIDIKEDGYCSVRILKDYETKPIYSHIGDIDNLKLLLNTINNAKYEKLIELIKNYMGLIESSFEYLLKKQSANFKSVDYGLFVTLVEENKYMIRLKKTSESFTVSDLLIKYFELIVKLTWQICGFQTQEIFLRTHQKFKIDHQYEIKKYIEKATNNYVRLSGTNKLHELFFRIQEYLEKKPQRNEPAKTNTINIQIIKTMIEKNEIDNSCLIVTLKENSSVIVESIENQELNIIRYHIGDFDSLGITNYQSLLQNRQSKVNGNNNRSNKSDEIPSPAKFIIDFADFIRFCLRAFYNKEGLEAKSDIFEISSVEPLKVRMKNSTEEYKINEIIIRYFQFIIAHSKKFANSNMIRKIVLITPNYFNIAKQFKLKDIVEKSRLEVMDVFSDNQLNNLFMKLHNKISFLLNDREDKLFDYNGVIKANDLEKENTFGIDLNDPKRVRVVVYDDDDGCFEVLCHIANIDETLFEVKDRLGMEDFTKLFEIAISSFNSKDTDKPINTQIFSASGRHPTKVMFHMETKSYSTEEILKCYFECIARVVWETTGIVAKNVVLAVPTDYSIETILMLDNCLKRANLKSKKLISQNGLYDVFFQINNLFFDSQIEIPLDSLIVSNTKINDESHNVCFNIDGNGAVSYKLIDTSKSSKNIFGDFESISREFMKNLRLLEKFKQGSIASTKAHNENIETAESFEKLINFCFEALFKNNETNSHQKFKLFKISSHNPLLIRIKKSENDLQPNDVLVCYFNAICTSIYRQTGIRPKFVTCVITRTTTINEKIKLKQCLEKAGLKLNKIISNNLLNDLFFNLYCQHELFLTAPKLDEKANNDYVPSKKKNGNGSGQKTKTVIIAEQNITDQQLPITSTPRPFENSVNMNLPSDISNKSDIPIDTESKYTVNDENKSDYRFNVPSIINSNQRNKNEIKSKSTSRISDEGSEKPKGLSIYNNQFKIENDVIQITFQEKGSAVIKSTKEDKIIDDHIGNFSVLGLLSNYKYFDSNIHDIEKITNLKSRIELIKVHKNLIRFCLIALKGFGPEMIPKENNIYRVSLSEQRVQFRKSLDAKAEEVLVTYLKCLMISISPLVAIETCKFEFKIDFDFSLYEQFEFKKCVQKANMNLLKIITTDSLNNLFFDTYLKVSRVLPKELEYFYVNEKIRPDIDLKKRLTENQKSFAVFLYDDYKVITTQDLKMVKVINHLGNFDKLNFIPDELDENYKNVPNFGILFKKLITTSIETFESKDEINIIKIENELFKTTDFNCIKLFNDDYNYSLLSVFYNYIECISRTISEHIGEDTNKLILATPFKNNITSEFRIKDIINQTRFHLIDIICENNLVNLFRKITHHMQQFSDFENKRGRKTMVPTKIRNSTLKKIGMNANTDNKNTLPVPVSYIDHVNKELLSFNIKSNGEIFANLAIDKNMLTITNHIGDYNALVSYASLKEQYIIEKRKNLLSDYNDHQDNSPESFEKLYSEIRLIKHYRKLIDICFQHTKGLEIDYQTDVDDIFEVINKKKKVFIRFKHADYDYEVTDVMGLYFESISNFVNRKIGVEVKNIKCVVSNDFDIYAQYEIRRCIERANLSLMQISTSDELQNLFLDIEAVFLQFAGKKLNKSIDNTNTTITTIKETKNKVKRRETFCIQLNVDGAAKISAVDDNCESRIVNHHVGDFSAIDNYNKDDAKTLEFIENYRNLIQFCINSLGKQPSDCFTQRINLFKVVKTDKIKFVSKLTSAEYTIEDVIMTYFKYMMTSVWKITKDKINQIILSIPLDYEEKIALKLCIEKANVKVMKIITKPLTKCFDIYLADSYNGKYGAYIFVDEDAVVLYKIENNRPMVVLSSLMDSKESYKEFMKSFNLHLKKQIPKCVNKLVNYKEFSKEILFKCYEQFNENKEEAELEFLDEKFKIKQTELYEMAQKYIEDTSQLINDILEQYNHDTSLNISCVYYVFANFMAEELKKVIHNTPILRYVDSNSALLNISAMSHKLTNINSTIGIIKTLNFNIGFCNHLGIFELLLKQGLPLPCETSKIFTTVVNYQTAIELELYRGYRPLERYCEFLGIVSVKDISIAKANKIKIDVKFHINENEELTVEAYERPSNKKLILETENFKMKSKYEHNFHDSVVNKENDENLVEKLKLTSSLINRIRSRYDGHTEYDELVSKKMDAFTNQIIESNKIIDIDGCEKIVEDIKIWLKENNLQMNF